MKVNWEGKERVRILGKPKYYNSVLWLVKEGKNPEEIRKVMWKRITARLNRNNRTGKNRQALKKGMQNRVRKMITLLASPTKG